MPHQHVCSGICQHSKDMHPAVLDPHHGTRVPPTGHGSTVAEAWGETNEALAEVRDLLG